MRRATVVLLLVASPAYGGRTLDGWLPETDTVPEGALDAGLVVDVNIGRMHKELRPGAGANVRITENLRLGAEIHAELALDSTTTSWAVVGPDVAWIRGRFWFAGAVGIGVRQITAAP